VLLLVRSLVQVPIITSD